MISCVLLVTSFARGLIGQFHILAQMPQGFVWQETHYTQCNSRMQASFGQIVWTQQRREEQYISKLSLVDVVDPYALTAADLVKDIECLLPFRLACNFT